MHRRIIPLLVLAAWLLPVAVHACNIPVFRYALERWRPGPYEAVVFHKGPLTAEQQEWMSHLEKAAADPRKPANVKVVAVDLAGPVDNALLKFWQLQEKPTLPWLVLRYPGSTSRDPSAWAGPFDQQAVQTLLHSPARWEVAQRLLQGHSVVWVLIESGNPKLDDTAAELMQGELKKLQETIKLPTEDDPDNAGREMVQLLSKVPLQVQFSMLRVSRTDPAEKPFLAMLLNADQDFAALTDVPIMFPIFGQGRALDPCAGKGINAENIAAAARFLCSACSCTVKELSPGYDLLFAADWQSILEEESAVPPLAVNKPATPVPIPQPSKTLQGAAKPSTPEAAKAQATEEPNQVQPRVDPGTVEAEDKVMPADMFPAGVIVVSFLLLLGLAAVVLVLAGSIVPRRNNQPGETMP